MSDATPVLYDLPGPRGRRRTRIASAVVLVLAVLLAVLVVRRFADQGQFSMELWGPLVDPGNESFTPVWQALGRGFQATLIAAALSICFSLVIGTLLGTSRMLLGRRQRIPLVGLIELLRGLPVVILIFIAYRVLPDLGVNVSPLPGEDGLWYLVIGLTAYNSVIIAEILRAGVASLPKGQEEAATAIGLSRVATMRLVLLPQAFRTMLPALISQLVVILKDTSLAGLIGVYSEALRQGIFIINELDNPFQTLFVIGTIFIVVNSLLSLLAVRIEARLRRAGRSTIDTMTIDPRQAGQNV